MATETVPSSDMRESIASALAEQSAPADQAEPTRSEATPAPDETKAAAQQPQQTEKAPGAAAESAGEDAIPGVDYTSLSPEQKRQLNKILTPKFQELAAERKRLEQLSRIQEAYESNPESVLQALAKEQGFSLTKAEAKQAAAEAAQGKDEAFDALGQLFGPEAAALLAPVLAAIADKQVKPLREQIEQQKAQFEAQRNAVVAQQTASDMKALGERHPDWKEHEATMHAIAQRLDPKPDQSPQEYLDELYETAKMRAELAALKAELTKNNITRQTNAAKAAESPDGGIASGKVALNPTEAPDSRESIQMAMRGEVVTN